MRHSIVFSIGLEALSLFSRIEATCASVRLLKRHPASSTAIRNGLPYCWKCLVAKSAIVVTSPSPITVQSLDRQISV